MMTDTLTLEVGDAAALELLAQVVALKARAGDTFALYGDLGAGKTTFARAFIRAVLDDPLAEVPSPTFALLQTYDTPRFGIRHFDLYRLAAPEELDDIGFDDDTEQAVCLVEWPERAGSLLPEPHIAIHIAEPGTSPEGRVVAVSARGDVAKRIGRVAPLFHLLTRHFPAESREGLRVRYMQGDASARAYARLSPEDETRNYILMDSPRQPDGPPIRDGLPYSRIAHLAEDIVPFLAVGDTLRRAGLSTPDCLAADAENGVAILEDFGTGVFRRDGVEDADQATLWGAAVDTLLALRAANLSDVARSDGGLRHTLPPYDARSMLIEVELLLDWYVPHALGRQADASERRDFVALWQPLCDSLAEDAHGWVLRDFHSPNLMWLPDREGARRVGLIDFQDALIGHPAYDLVSLLQDARLDVPEALEQALLATYLARAFGSVQSAEAIRFRVAYAILGAQRNTKILGIFARLAERDGKRQYLAHIPRIQRYLARNLAHPALSSLAAWYKDRLGER
ncbi:MAG: tRNA (adenosine(37)-N6)-threonylcarbamoyltransferase complex ATPase subunit type 1 TsaE [Hyphomicrobiaceae bacterium]|nr:tRNA (adenosine(37)-N6)-threonylcarbamoyltransferase complex ATPase subunit type 1 TsaE [Hyphomicrobiaceae bacterium]